MQKKNTVYDLLTQGGVGVLVEKFSPFASIPMEVTTQKTNVDQIDFFKQDSEVPANFSKGFSPEKPNIANSSSNSKEIDLSLKLSLDGPRGQNAEEMLLTRSSTIAGELTLMANSSVPSLDRSSSLPVEAEKGLVRFGDLQAMIRLETGKRWLQEKLRRAAAAAEAKKSPGTADASKVPAASPGIDQPKMLANPSGDPSKHEGSRGLAEVGASSNIQTSANKGKDVMVYPKTITRDLAPRPADTKLEYPSKKPRFLEPCSLKGDDMEILRKMPSVTTTGDGPGGKRIQGFLYTYRRGEVCIVCVCHGSFLSPAEFVMHAGGKDVANPMKHITVCSSSF